MSYEVTKCLTIVCLKYYIVCFSVGGDSHIVLEEDTTVREVGLGRSGRFLCSRAEHYSSFDELLLGRRNAD